MTIDLKLYNVLQNTILCSALKRVGAIRGFRSSRIFIEKFIERFPPSPRAHCPKLPSVKMFKFERFLATIP